jgi:leucyl-tRNA synthetase/predicted alpha/beta hydrolase family esterase
MNSRTIETIHEMEAKWQKTWAEAGTYTAKTGNLASKQDKFYGLIEFPYPSGEGLHVGHPRSYTAIDLVTRKHRMQGKNVLYPIGWDAFGLPTENFAIKHKIRPADATKRNIGNFTRQIKSLGFGFDWTREVDTTDPKYYKWTQWQFLQFLKAGLAYKAKSTINWCPKCKIGLANEEAQGGVCERCGTPVEKREKAQWMIKISKYADRLIDDLQTVDYLDKIAAQQVNWIGRSEGAEIVFRVAKFEKVLVATNNKSKLARAKKLLGAFLPGLQVLSPAEAGLEAREVQEGDDMLENARCKAASYAGLTDLPVLGMDSGLYISGENLNVASPKRNALGGVPEETLTQEQKAAYMDSFYRGIAAKHGGEVEGYWHDFTVLRMPDGTEVAAENKRNIILTDHRIAEMDIYLPVHSLYKVGPEKKYATELSEDGVIHIELEAFAKSLVTLCSEEVRVFTTRPDTLFGVTYVTLAPEHKLVQAWLKNGKIKNWEAVQAYIEQVKSKTDMERTAETKDKTGVPLEGVFATNPVNGEQVPVWIADYVLAGYGTGAVMAVPAHDERDYAFAKKFGLSIKQVVAPYIKLSGEYAPKEGKETASRKVVTAIIRHRQTGKYLLQDMADSRRGFTGGGVEGEENLEEAVRREVSEETGYAEMTIVKRIGEVWGHGYKPKKDRNCFDPDTAFLVEVDGEPTRNRSEEDLTAHELVWKEAAEVEGFVNLQHHLALWRTLQENGECFTEEGVAAQTSGFLSGSTTKEAKEKMIQWLETHNAGKRLKTYKLRDWVFSRQRYWGEPIPLVHCEACAQKKQKALLIHGFSGSGEKGWFPTIKKELEAQGYEVFAPTMAMTDGPTIEAWMELLKPYMEQLGEDDVVVGHSIGARAAVELLERTRKKIDRLVLVAPAIGEYPVARYEQRLKDEPQRKADFDFLRAFWQKPIDWKRVESLVGSAVVMRSSDDAIIQKPTHAIYPAGWLLQSYEGKGHFQEVDQPELLEHILSHKVTGWIPVPDAQLPVTLPEVEAYEPTDTGESPLAKIDAWVNTICPKCGGPATRETDTMPNWAGSSWYFLRYCDPQNDQQFASPEALKYWLPIDLYNGGMEHTTLHLLYSRFWHKFLYDMGYIPEECGSEPYAMRRSHDMILGEGGVKMSKSKGNVVNPDDVVKEYGADVFRLYEMFIGPYDQKAPWDTNGVEGVRRFMDRVWYVFHQPQVTDRAVPSDLETLYHQTIKKVTDGIDHLQFNTPVSQMMILANAYQEFGCVPTAHRDGFMQVLAPYAPHMAEELWQEEKHEFSIHRAGWPTYDAAKLVSDTFELVIQVNGKVRDKVTVAKDIVEDEAKKLALASEAVQKWLEGKEPQKVVYVKGRLVSVVV